MSDDIPVSQFEVRYEGLFDFDYFYKEAVAWIKRHGYTFDETIHKFKPPELELNWKNERKDTGYRRTDLGVYIHIWQYKEVVVKVKGKEKKMVNGRIMIMLNSKMVLDYNNIYEKNPFLKTMRNFLHRFILFYKIFLIDYDKVHFELVDLQTFLRGLLDTSLPGGPKRAY